MKSLIPMYVTILFIGCLVIYEKTAMNKKEDSNTPKPHVTVIHVGDEGCPSGYTPHIDYFMEEDGSMQGACVAFWEGGEGTQIDYLLSGETVTLNHWNHV